MYNLISCGLITLILLAFGWPDSPFFGVLMSPWWLLVGYLLLLAAAAIRHVSFKVPSSKVIISLLLSFVVSYLIGSVLAFVFIGPQP